MNPRNPERPLPAGRFVWIGLLLVLALNCFIRWRLLDLPLERDEGEYAYAGQLIREGVPPYQLAWNMKFPGVYYAYAGLMSVFGETPAGIHLGILLVTSLSILLVFLIGRELMGGPGGLMAAMFFTLLTAVPFTLGLAGHATHFVVVFVCLGTYALLTAKAKKPLLWTGVAGAAFGLAMVMKQHALVFMVAALGWQLWEAFQKKEKFVRRTALFIGAAAVPLLLTGAGMAVAGVWDRFNLWTIQYAREYVGLFSLSAAPAQFAKGFGPIFDEGIWVWLAGLAAMGWIGFRNGRKLPVLLGAGLLLSGLVAASPGFYFRGHYFLMVMPGLALLNAAAVLAMVGQVKKFPAARALRFLPACLFLVITGDLLVRNAGVWFSQSPEEISRKLYGNSPFVEAPAIAQYLAAHSKPGDTIAVLGSEPELFFLAHRRSASGYIYVYPLTEPQRLGPVMRQEFIQEIEAARPACVVQVNILSSWCSVVIPSDTPQVLEGFHKWWDGYAKDYHLAGIVDLADDGPAQFFWEGEMSTRTNEAPPGVSIYVRN